MLTRSIQDFISNSKINRNWSRKSIEINRNFENFRLLFSTSKRRLFEKLFLTGGTVQLIVVTAVTKKVFSCFSQRSHSKRKTHCCWKGRELENNVKSPIMRGKTFFLSEILHLYVINICI